MTDLLSFEDALSVVDEMGLVVSDAGLLASAVGRPAATVFGEDAYPDLATKVAALLESAVRNHSLVDGNKRLGWVLAVVTIRLNDVEIDYNEDEAFAMVMAIAEGSLGLPGIDSWFTERLRVSNPTTGDRDDV